MSVLLSKLLEVLFSVNFVCKALYPLMLPRPTYLFLQLRRVNIIKDILNIYSRPVLKVENVNFEIEV